MSTQTFEASSVEKALEEASGALGVPESDLQYEVEEKASDFWGLGETVYVVTVTLAQSEPAAPQAPAVEPVAPGEVTPESTETETGETEDETPSAQPPVSEDAVAPFFALSEQEADGEEGAGNDESGAPTEQDAGPAAGSSEPPASEPMVTEPMDTEPMTPAPVSREPESSEPPAETAAEGGAAPEGTDLTAEAAGILDGIFAAMGFECSAEAKLDGDTMQVAITGEDNQYLLEGRGRGLAALELILNHSFRAWPNRAHKRVRVDAGDFRSQRDEEIRDMAYQVAHLAKESGSEQQTSDLNPYERRIVHLTLADDPAVTTRSLGNGFLKAVNVIPTRGGQRRDQ